MDSYPLKWPSTRSRTKWPQRSRFNPNGSRTFSQSIGELYRQLKLLGASGITVTSNMPLRLDGFPMARGIKSAEDQGCAVYFTLKKQERCLSCDAWDRLSDNAWAIAKHIDALRGQERWGVLTAAESIPVFRLPSKLPWYRVLGVSQSDSYQVVRASFRRLSKLHHPDMGGDRVTWERVAEAWQEYQQEVQTHV